ncbi:hypothetical protein O181_019249 [Austropuccinia psidii MF-1]|uniref:Uncharacterized protein n=1 Tax=Austropuccinia psidii MF-1 TaxID=1389203 RepID=A0A9Q3C6Q5_9BASI|nr:hypothetical protein [Austropuccinia psidii MF-1]
MSDALTNRAKCLLQMSVPELRADLDGGPNLEGAAPSRKEGRGVRRSNSFAGVVGVFPGTSRTTFKAPGEDDEEEEDNSVEEEVSDGTEGVPAPMGTSQGTGGPTPAQSNQPMSHKPEPSLLEIMHQMTQIMANFKAVSSFEYSRPPTFNTPSMRHQTGFIGHKPSKSEVLFSAANSSFIMIRQISLRRGSNLFIPLHFSLAGLKI